MDNDSFLSLKGRSEGLFKAKGSKHFGFAVPVRSEDDVKAFLGLIRKEHHSARHHCYAYRLGHDGSIKKSTDDGEPSNSAGPPILGVLRSHNLTNALIVVVRYFGGTKLGVGGLIEAYREAGRAAVESGDIITCIRTNTFIISYPYAKMGEVMSILKRADISPENTEFKLTCSLEATIRLRDSDVFEKQMSNVDEVQVELCN
jgi:uncharacterized YigZ family protein|tara:strand:- start:1462 stop:2067 length:606 start_codon:yes stop_codon:yes gene_type:complete